LGGIAVSLACLPQGRFVVAGLTDTGVTGRAFDAQSQPIGQFVIPVSVSAGFGPTVAVLPNEALIWDECFAGGAPGCDIFAQPFALNTNPDCPGDCNGDGVVTVDQIMLAVDLVLREQSGILDDPLSCIGTEECPAVDTDLDCQVTINEIVAAVNRALEGCR
jgi:hypothetical protein